MIFVFDSISKVISFFLNRPVDLLSQELVRRLILKFSKSELKDLEVGAVDNGFGMLEVLTDRELAHHVHVVGASGYGKSVFLNKILRSKLSKDSGLLFIDLKGDLEMIGNLKSFVNRNGLEQPLIFNIADVKSSAQYNLLGGGNATEIRDRIISSLIWSEEFYKTVAGSFLLKLLIGLCYLRDTAGEEFDVGDVLELTHNLSRHRELASKVPEKATNVRPHVLEAQRYIGDAAGQASLQGLRSQLESIVYSNFGSLVTNVRNPIDLFQAAKNQKAVFMFLDTRRYGETAKAIGRFILQDLKSVSSKIDTEVALKDRNPFLVMIDEFADLAEEDFIGFLDRARSSKMSIVISHQELADLKRVSPEFAARITGNTSTLYAFLQKNEESANAISGMAGTRTVQKVTHQTDRIWLFDVKGSKGTVRETEEFIIHPNRIKRLKVGECAVVKKYPFARAHIVRVDAEA